MIDDAIINEQARTSQAESDCAEQEAAKYHAKDKSHQARRRVTP